jgi:Co/Zn/Cd efflux system component
VFILTHGLTTSKLYSFRGEGQAHTQKTFGASYLTLLGGFSGSILLLVLMHMFFNESPKGKCYKVLALGLPISIIIIIGIVAVACNFN